MAEPPDERDRGRDEDLFEDLDQFFAPVEDQDWPEDLGGDEAGRVPGQAPPPATPREPAPPPDVGTTPGEPLREDDLSDLESLDIEGDLLSDIAGQTVAPADTGPGGEARRRREVEDWDQDREEEWIAEATAEMGPEEAVVPEPGAPESPPEPGAPATRPEPAAGAAEETPRPQAPAPGSPTPPPDVAEPTPAPPRAEPPAVGEAGGPATAPEGQLSVDDLRAPPPEYAGLPAPPGDEEEAVLAEEAVIPEPEDEGMVSPPVPPVPPAGPGAGAGTTETTGPLGPPIAPEAPPPGPPRPPAAPREAPGPEPEAVEAADHFAEGVRERPEDVERELLADLEEEEPETRTVRIGPSGATGPTWQDEGARPVVPEDMEEGPPGPAAEGRNLIAAFASGILLAAAVIALLAIGKGAFVVLATAAILLAQAELYAVMRARGNQPATLLGIVCGGLIVVGAYLKGEGAALFGLSVGMLMSVVWYMAAPAKSRRGTLANAALTVMGIVYVPFLASFALLLLAVPGDLGRNVFMTVLGLAVLYDVCAYAIGSLWGSRSLAPTISPQKSWEGAIGATFVLLLAALAIVPSIDPFTGSTAIGVALVIAAAAPIGDLVESAIKRDLGVKDMGSLLPGHGGMLDRIDSVLFAAPAAYWFLRVAFG